MHALHIASHKLRVSQLLGSNGGEGHRKHLRALAKEAEKGARAAADAAKEARFYQPEPLSPEFAFVVRVRNRCAAGLRLALPRGAGRALHRQGVEVRQCNDRALTVRELRRIGSSGLLLNALMQLTRLSNCPNPSAAVMCRLILARVAARLVSHASPEVCFVVLRLSLIFLTLVQFDFQEGVRAYAAGQHLTSIAFFERAIQWGHASAHAALAWLLRRVYIDSDMGFRGLHHRLPERIFELAKNGARMGCRQGLLPPCMVGDMHLAEDSCVPHLCVY